MLTRAGLATIALGIVCLAVARVFGIFELYIVAAVALALVACGWIWVVLNSRALESARTVTPARVHAGGQAIVTLAITNRRILPTPVARITDEVGSVPRADAHVPPLPRGRVTKASYRVPAERRGLIELGPMHTAVSDPFALASITRRSAPDTSILVLPAYDLIAPPPRPSGDLSSRPDRAPGRIGAHGDEFSSLRSYVVGDDLRKVHWPSTARAGELVVRTEHVPEHGHSVVLLDVRETVAEPETFERMVSAVTSIVMACAARGDEIRMLTSAGHQRLIDGSRSLDNALDDLALVTQQPGEASDLIATMQTSAADTGVMVLGRRLDFAGSGGTLGAGQTIAVQFVDRGATPASDPRELRSQRMATVTADLDFATVWGEVIGEVPQTFSASVDGGEAIDAVPSR